jgi:asparagine synthase (glutamine-hydrolysing)
MKIKLLINKGFPWIKSNGTYTKGYAFINNEFYPNKKLNDIFKNIFTIEEFNRQVKLCNGSFAIILERNDIIFAAVDIVRSIPLFYSFKQNIISDSAEEIVNEIELIQYNPTNVQEFFTVGHTTGIDTVVDGLFQVQPGEVAVLKNNFAERTEYFKYRHEALEDRGREKYKKKFQKVLENTYSRLAHFSKNKQIVIPLSAGYDSRLNVLMCKMMGINNITLFTYGTENSHDAIGAKLVAKALGLPIHFIDYSKGQRLLYKSSVSNEYDKTAFNYTSIPYIQDFQALNFLINKNLIPNESIIVTGHSGDFISGRHLENLFSQNERLPRQTIIDEIYRKQYSIYRPKTKNMEILKNKIDRVLLNEKDLDCGTIYESWVWKERQAKFLINSVRQFEFFNFEWALPLWDLEFIEFFLQLPKKYRVYQNFYSNFIEALLPGLVLPRKKRGKYAWLQDYRFKRYGISEYLNMIETNIKLSKFTRPNPRILHQLNLTRFKYLIQ